MLLFFVFIIFLPFSCENSEKGSTSESIDLDDKEVEDTRVLDEILAESGSNFKYLNNTCLKKLESAFIYADVWPAETSLKEACIFKPVNSPLYNSEKDLFIALFFEHNSKSIYEVYSIYTPLDIFRPVHIKEDSMIVDSLYTVELYFETPFECGGIKIDGSDYKSKDKIGIFEKL